MSTGATSNFLKPHTLKSFSLSINNSKTDTYNVTNIIQNQIWIDPKVGLKIPYTVGNNLGIKFYKKKIIK